MLWYDESGTVITTPALPVPPERIVDTSGAGDVFHGAYVYSYLADPRKPWAEHFRFAQHASAFKIQRLGNEKGLPTLADIAAVEQEFAAIPADVGPARARKRAS
jgi:sugar/nucleoside kinase (ribokinase family)